MVCTKLVVERCLHVEVRPLCTSLRMVDTSQGAGKCTRPPCRELAHAYKHACRTIWPFRPLRRPSSTERGRQKNRKTGRTIARSLPPGHALAISRWPERRLFSCIQRSCGPAQSACRRFEVPRQLRVPMQLHVILKDPQKLGWPLCKPRHHLCSWFAQIMVCACVRQNCSVVPSGGWWRSTPPSSTIPETLKPVRKFRGKQTSSCSRTSQNRHIRPSLTERTPMFLGSTPLSSMRTDKDEIAGGIFVELHPEALFSLLDPASWQLAAGAIWEETVPCGV